MLLTANAEGTYQTAELQDGFMRDRTPRPWGKSPHPEREIPYTNGVIALYAALSRLPNVVASLDRISFAANPKPLGSRRIPMSRVPSSRRSAGSSLSGPEHKPIVRVLLADDHRVVRAGLRALLESIAWIDVVGEASSGEEAVDKARALEPDIVTMDLAMPGMDGIQATRRITELGVQTKVLVLTIHDEDEFLITALDVGAAGFLNKSAADTDLPGAIEAVVRGHSYPPRRAADLLARREAQGRVETANGIPRRRPDSCGPRASCYRAVPPPHQTPGEPPTALGVISLTNCRVFPLLSLTSVADTWECRIGRAGPGQLKRAA